MTVSQTARVSSELQDAYEGVLRCQSKESRTVSSNLQTEEVETEGRTE